MHSCDFSDVFFDFWGDFCEFVSEAIDISGTLLDEGEEVLIEVFDLLISGVDRGRGFWLFFGHEFSDIDGGDGVGCGTSEFGFGMGMSLNGIDKDEVIVVGMFF